MKRLLALTILTFCCYSTDKAQLASQLRSDLQYLWSSSAVLTREYLIGITLDLPSAKLAAQQLLDNHEEIGQLLVPLYGKEKAQEFTLLMKKQAQATLDIIDASKKNDKEAKEKALQDWKRTAYSISTFLDKTNPYLQYRVLNELFMNYLTFLIAMTTDRLEKKWEQDMTDYHALRNQLNKLISLVGKSFTDAFPKPISKEPPPRPRVTVPLPAGTSLRTTP